MSADHISRRAALTIATGAIAAGTIGTTPARPLPDAMSAAIRLHRIAWDALGETCNLTDEVVAKQEGRVITEADELTHRAAMDAEQAAQDRIFGTPISSLAEMSAFVAWATWLYDGGEDLCDHFLETMRRAPILRA
jgi:hypothetical protein